MARWLGRLMGAGVALALAGCAAAPTDRWQHDPGASHPLAGQIFRGADGAQISAAELIAAARDADFVLIGERHDNLDHHRLEAYLVEELQSDGRRPRALALEMVAADRQLALVEHLQARPGDAAGLGAAVGWDASGWPAWSVYAPVAGAALRNGGQIIAADLPADQKQAVFDRGSDALRTSFVQRTGLDRSFAPTATAALREELDDAHCEQAPPDALAGMARVQRARDAMMADRLAVASGRGGGILIAGNVHVRNDRGVPWYLARRQPGAKVVTIGLLEVQDDVLRPPVDLPYDFVWFTPRVDDKAPCAGAEIDLLGLRGAS